MAPGAADRRLVITRTDGSRGMDGALQFLLRVEYAIATRSR
ncbi:MAG: hypothetical protein ACK6DP_12060 [Gemmatimonas sp.]